MLSQKPNKESGFTLAEILISVGILGIVSVGASSLLKNYIVTGSQIKIDGEGVDLRSYVRQTMDCSATMAPVSCAAAPASTDVTLKGSGGSMSPLSFNNKQRQYELKASCSDVGGIAAIYVSYLANVPDPLTGKRHWKILNSGTNPSGFDPATGKLTGLTLNSLVPFVCQAPTGCISGKPQYRNWANPAEVGGCKTGWVAVGTDNTVSRDPNVACCELSDPAALTGPDVYYSVKSGGCPNGYVITGVDNLSAYDNSYYPVSSNGGWFYGQNWYEYGVPDARKIACRKVNTAAGYTLSSSSVMSYVGSGSGSSAGGPGLPGAEVGTTFVQSLFYKEFGSNFCLPYDKNGVMSNIDPSQDCTSAHYSVIKDSSGKPVYPITGR